MKHHFLIPIFAITSHIALADPVIELVAGSELAESGHKDDIGANAIFNDPTGMVRDASGNIFLCDARNHVIRKISAAGEVTTFAGKAGVEGMRNGKETSARFRFPMDIAIANNGDLYVADSGNHCIRRITPKGAVSTLAGSPGNSNDIKKGYGKNYITVSRSLDGKRSAARFDTPSGIVHAAGMLYVSDTGNHTIRAVQLNGTVTTLAGKAGDWGHADGNGNSARFNAPLGLCLGHDGHLYLADSENHAIRRISTAGEVSTFSENPTEEETSPAAYYFTPSDITTHPEGGYVVCDSFSNSLIKVSEQGVTSNFAQGFSGPTSIASDDLGNVFVSDTFHQQVRKLLAK